MAERILINVMRRKTKPKLVLLIRCRREKCKNILHRLLIDRENSHTVPVGREKTSKCTFLAVGR